jgi:hypothetical protein
MEELPAKVEEADAAEDQDKSIEKIGSLDRFVD